MLVIFQSLPFFIAKKRYKLWAMWHIVYCYLCNISELSDHGLIRFFLKKQFADEQIKYSSIVG
jgi:hypothetical protein